MAERARLAAAGFFLALTLAVVPALLPVRFAGAAGAPRVETVHPLVQLRGGSLAAPVASTLEPLPKSAPPAAMPQAAPRSSSVAPEDTLWKISGEAGASAPVPAAPNHLTLEARLHPDQVLTIPPLEPANAEAALVSHEVVAGDTLWSISRASGVPIETLAAVNHLPPEGILRLGQRLVVPPADRTVPWLLSPPARNAVHPLLRSPGVQATSGVPLLAGDLRTLEQPSEGLITSRFGWRIHPIFGTREFHTGLDIANRIGTPIRAAESGIVRFVGWMGGYGRLIVVAHANGFETSYSHLSSMLVSLGQRVMRGDLLGRMGNSGWSTGPHLLFEVRRNGVPLDPMPFLRGQAGILVLARDAGASTGRPAARRSAPPSPVPAAAPSRASKKAAPVPPPATATAPSAAGDASAPVAPTKEHRVVGDQDVELPPTPPASAAR
jgi:murein DD-endopeptidase MepM/ murein hydrolase activator NlpD